jgi:hypothetical protein
MLATSAACFLSSKMDEELTEMVRKCGNFVTCPMRCKMTVSRKKKVWGQISEKVKNKSAKFPTFCIIYLEDPAFLLLPKFL